MPTRALPILEGQIASVVIRKHGVDGIRFLVPGNWKRPLGTSNRASGTTKGTRNALLVPAEFQQSFKLLRCPSMPKPQFEVMALLPAIL